MKQVHAILALAVGTLCAGLRAQTYTFSTVPASIYSPWGVALDASGSVYVSGGYNNTVYKLSSTGTILTQYGNGSPGAIDGTGPGVRFNYPRGLAVDAAGNVYVADNNNQIIRKITPTGVVSTFAGLAGTIGNADGLGSVARFNYPQALAIDSAGNLFVADTNNQLIRKITPAGLVSTFAGSLGQIGGDDGTGAAARFNFPLGLAIDSANNLYVADTTNHTIRKITPAAVVTTVAGSASNGGSVDGPAAFARFYFPYGVAVDSSGNLFVADTSNYAIRKISGGTVTTIGGLIGSSGDAPGVGSSARFYGPRGLAVDASGNLFVGDSSNLKLGTTSGQLAITVQPQGLTVGFGSTALFSVTATGTGPLSYQWQKNGTAITGATNATYSIASVQSADTATYTVTVNNSVGTLASTGATLTTVAAVSNDNFANAQTLNGSSGSVSGNNNGATGEPGEPTHNVAATTASSVWYKWTPTESGTAVFNITSSTFTVGAAAYTGSGLTSLTRLFAGNSTRFSIKVTAGTTYSIALGSAYVGSRGNFTLTWRTILNDDFANAQAITGNSGSVAGNNDGATREPAESTAYSLHNSSVWYRWTPTQTGTAVVDISYGWDTAVYTGSTVEGLTAVSPLIGVGGLFPEGSAQRRVFVVQAGTTYSIAAGTLSYAQGSFTLNWRITTLPVIAILATVSTNSGNNLVSATLVTGASATFSSGPVVSATPVSYQWYRNGTPISGATNSTFILASVQSSDAGTYSLTVTNAAGSVSSTSVGNTISLTVSVPPANDNFANAAAITGLSGQATGTNVNATGEDGEPVHWNLSGTASSVWYKWTPTASGLASVDTVGSNFDTVMAVYTGPSLTNLTRLTQDDDRGGGRTSLVSFAATAGTTYYIAIGGSYNGARGNITLNWQLTPVLAVTVPPANTTVVVGGSATFSVTATGNGTVTYQWNRNGTAIPGATNPTLTIGNIQGGADASYTVTVTNSSGSITSAPATLTVAAPTLTNLTIRNTRAGAGMLWGAAAGGNTLVAVGDGGVIISSTDGGRTWAPRLSGTTNWIVGVTYGDGKFVAVADKGLILLSTDGVTWTSAASSGTAFRMNNVIYADGKFVAVGEGGMILTSIDANIWTPRISNTTNWLHGLAYNAALRTFATSGQGGVFLYSSDGVTWNKLPITGLTTDLEATVAVDGYAHFVSIGADGLEVSVRQNQVILKTGETLVTWNGTTSQTGSSARFRGLAQGASALFATGEGGKVVTATSDAGPWFTLPSGTDANLLAGIYYNNSLFIVGERETVIQSDPLFASRLINISTRGQVGTDSNIMISGFVVTGTQPKQVLVRAAGPTLAASFGLGGTLANPVLKVLDAQGVAVGSNIGWTTAANSAAIASTAARVGAFPFGATSADSATLLTLSPGLYTAQVSGVNNGTGLAIVEAYDADTLSNDTSRAINISTRGLVGTGANKLIAGFVIDGASSRRVLIRAVGPGLAAAPFNLTGTLAEPQLELYNGKGLLHSTAAAWGLQTNADEIRGSIDAAGAFKLADGSKDSAMVVTLLPGAWTVQVSGANGGTGVAIIEVYALP